MAVAGFVILQIVAMSIWRAYGQECSEAHDFQAWGPYEIGRRVYSIEVAPEVYPFPTPFPSGEKSRLLDTTVFYPTSASFTKGDDVPVGEVLMAALGNSVSGFQRVLLSSLASTLTIPARSKLNVQIAEAQGGSYPLVFWMHGDFSSHHLSNTYLEHIASYGFVVIASDHPGIAFTSTANFPIFPESEMLHDVSQLLDKLESSTDGSDGIGYDFGKYVNTSAYALVGHSRGGLAAFIAGSLGGKVKLNAGLMISPHWRGSDYLRDYESYLQVGGTADPRYTASECLAFVQEANASNFKSMLMIKDAPHDVSVMTDTCPFLARPYIKPFLGYLEQMREFEETTGACRTTDKALVTVWADVLKTALISALVRAFDNSDCALSTLRRMKQEFPNTVLETYTQVSPSMGSARLESALTEHARGVGADSDFDLILNRSDLIWLVVGLILIVASAFVLVVFHGFRNEQLSKPCDVYNPLLGCDAEIRGSVKVMAV